MNASESFGTEDVAITTVPGRPDRLWCGCGVFIRVDGLRYQHGPNPEHSKDLSADDTMWSLCKWVGDVHAREKANGYSYSRGSTVGGAIPVEFTILELDVS